MGSFFFKEKSEDFDGYISLFLGIGCFLAWICNLKTLSFYEGFDIVNRVFSHCVYGIVLFSAGITPIFCAYVFSGWCMYHEAEDRLEELDISYITFVALFAADELQELFFAINEDNYIFSYIWGYSYCVLFIFFIADVYVSLVEGAFDIVVTEMAEEAAIE